KAKLLEKIAELVQERKIEGIADLRDESDREGMRMVIELKRDAVAQVVLNQLFKHTQMQVTFGIILLAIVHGQPQTLHIKDLLQQFNGSGHCVSCDHAGTSHKHYAIDKWRQDTAVCIRKDGWGIDNNKVESIAESLKQEPHLFRPDQLSRVRVYFACGDDGQSHNVGGGREDGLKFCQISKVLAQPPRTPEVKCLAHTATSQIGIEDAGSSVLGEGH
ncbi:MAG: hypothetical protein LAO09_22810, partial [Acidobacteriia bacterium]|nr:hypothetical protein [Terriglobia bacterium]